MPYRSDASLWFNLPGVIAAWQPVACPAGALAARQNVVANAATPTRYAATAGVAPTFSPRVGWGFTGTQALEALFGPPQDTQAGSLLIRYSDWTRDSYTMLIGTFFGESGVREFNIGRNGSYSIANHGILNSVTLPASGVVGFAGTAAYIDGANVGTLNSPGVYGTRRLIIGAAVYYNTGTAYYHATANIQAAIVLNRTLSPSEAWSASRQMAYCHVNPAWSAWGRRRRYYYVEHVEPTADDLTAAAARMGAFGPRLGAAARTGQQQAAALPAAARAGHRSRLNG